MNKTNQLRRISFYDSPEALGLIECLKINMESFVKSLEYIKIEQSIDEYHPTFIKNQLQKQFEYAERLEKLFTETR